MLARLYINKIFLLLLLPFLVFLGDAHAQLNWHTKVFNEKDGLLQDKINCLYLDTKGFLWIGTDAGLFRYDGNLIKPFDQYATKPKQELGKCIGFLQAAGNSFVYDDSSFFLIDDFSLSYQGKSSKKPKSDFQKLIQKTNLSLNTLAETQSGFSNIFAINNQIFLLKNGQNNKIKFSKIVATKPIDTKFYALPNLLTELELHDGKVFICNERAYLLCKEGLFSISYSKEGYLLATPLIDGSLLTAYSINSIAITPDEKMVVLGTIGQKIIKLSKHKLVNAVYTKVSELPKTIYDSIHYKQINYNAFKALPENSIQRINRAQGYIEDNNGKIWIPTNEGLYVIHNSGHLPKTNEEDYRHYWVFTTEDGLPSNEFIINNQNEYYFDKSNSFLYLPTLKGIVAINTNSIEQASGAYPPQISQITIDNNQQTKWPSNLEKFSQISLSVAVPMGIKSKNYQIEYRLMPTESKWNKISDGKIIISRMTPGEQTIELRYNNGLTNPDYLYSRHPLFFKPFWYESVWIRIAGILAAMGLITGLYLIREYQLRKQNKKLNIRIEQKTIEVKRQMRKLKAVTQQNEMLIGVLAHDIKSPLRSISTLTTLLGGKLENTNPEELSSHLREISKTSNKLSQFIGQFLVWYGQRSEKDLLFEPVEIKKMIEEIVQYANEMNINRSNTIITSFDEAPLLLNTNKQVLSIIIHNLLDNAGKYTHKGTITVSAHWKGRELVISCTDTGIGMSPETIDQLLKNESRVSPTMPDSYKLGYVFINGLIKQINARLIIESEPGKGSTVSVLVKARQS